MVYNKYDKREEYNYKAERKRELEELKRRKKWKQRQGKNKKPFVVQPKKKQRVIVLPDTELQRQVNERLNAKSTFKESWGEKYVKEYLIELGIEFEPEYPFADLVNPRTKHILFFDFYIPSLNLCIEYDGIYHERNKDKVALDSQRYRDKLKNDYCDLKKINLLRINYRVKTKNIRPMIDRMIAAINKIELKAYLNMKRGE